MLLLLQLTANLDQGRLAGCSQSLHTPFLCAPLPRIRRLSLRRCRAETTLADSTRLQAPDQTWGATSQPALIYRSTQDNARLETTDNDKVCLSCTGEGTQTGHGQLGNANMGDSSLRSRTAGEENTAGEAAGSSGSKGAASSSMGTAAKSALHLTVEFG